MAKLFNKKVAPTASKTDYAPLPRPKYSFVEQYTIVDPKKVMNGGYRMWQLCKTVPVVCEESSVSSCGFLSGIEMPTDIVLGFLNALEKAPAETIVDPKMRTLSIIHLSKDQRVVVGPDLKNSKTPIFWAPDSKGKGDWVMYVTPEKNRAIVDALKLHTR